MVLHIIIVSEPPRPLKKRSGYDKFPGLTTN